MTKSKSIMRLVFETDRTIIFRSGGSSQGGWCRKCRAMVDVEPVALAARHVGLSELAVYSNRVHFTSPKKTDVS